MQVIAIVLNPGYGLLNFYNDKRVLVLERLTDDDVLQILKGAIARATSIPDAECTGALHVTPKVMDRIVSLSLGDARTALNLLELVLKAPAESTMDGIMTTLKKTCMSRFVILPSL
jgi:putative ATPase